MADASAPNNGLTIDLKLTFNSIQRRLSCSTTCPSWKDLSKQIQQRFSLPDDFELGLSYVDDDGESVVLSSDKELAEVWPIITEYHTEDLDALPPLRFALVRLPAAERSVSATPTVSDDATSYIRDDKDPQSDVPNPPEKDKKTSLKEDIIAFIEIVKVTVKDNDKIKKAFDKVMAHSGTDKKHGNEFDEPEDIDMAVIINEETGKLDAMTAGIVSALLAPALMGPPHPFPHPPPPHFGRHHHPLAGRPHGPPFGPFPGHDAFAPFPPAPHHAFPGRFGSGVPYHGAQPHCGPGGPTPPPPHGGAFPHHGPRGLGSFGRGGMFGGRGGMFGGPGSRRGGFPYPPSPPPHPHRHHEGAFSWDGRGEADEFGAGRASHFGPWAFGPFGGHGHHHGRPSRFEGFGRSDTRGGWVPVGGKGFFGYPGRQDDFLSADFARMHVNPDREHAQEDVSIDSETSSDSGSDTGEKHDHHHRHGRGMRFGGGRHGGGRPFPHGAPGGRPKDSEGGRHRRGHERHHARWT